MELIGIEHSRIISLRELRRPAGQLYGPDAVAKLRVRYSFLQHPTAENLLRDDVFAFAVGRFEDVQIQELRIFPDGVIASSKSTTSILDRFVDDLFSWAETELGITAAPIPKPETHYESAVVVRAGVDLVAATRPKREIEKEITFRFRNTGLDSTANFQPSGFLFDLDHTTFRGRRRPTRFIIERRVGIAYEENAFFSLAPLKTDDHIAVLARIEEVGRG